MQIYRSESREENLSPVTKANLQRGKGIVVQTQFDFALDEHPETELVDRRQPLRVPASTQAL